MVLACARLDDFLSGLTKQALIKINANELKIHYCTHNTAAREKVLTFG
jgi:hypothetical protein